MGHGLSGLGATAAPRGHGRPPLAPPQPGGAARPPSAPAPLAARAMVLFAPRRRPFPLPAPLHTHHPVGRGLGRPASRPFRPKRRRRNALLHPWGGSPRWEAVPGV